MDAILNRALLLIRMAGPKRLSELGGTNHERWKNISKGAIRMGTEELGVLAGLYPQYALWLISGRVATEIGQACPDGAADGTLFVSEMVAPYRPKGNTSPLINFNPARTSDRARLLLKLIGPRKASRQGGDYDRWKSVSRGLVRVSADEIDVLAQLFPQYALWLASGNTAPEIGQSRPDYAVVGPPELPAP